jgi:hypothetical protein
MLLLVKLRICILFQTQLSISSALPLKWIYTLFDMLLGLAAPNPHYFFSGKEKVIKKFMLQMLLLQTTSFILPATQATSFVGCLPNATPKTNALFVTQNHLRQRKYIGLCFSRDKMRF